MYSNRELYIEYKKDLDLADLYITDLKNSLACSSRLLTYIQRKGKNVGESILLLPSLYIKSIDFAGFQKNFSGDVNIDELHKVYEALGRIILFYTTQDLQKVYIAVPMFSEIIKLLSSMIVTSTYKKTGSFLLENHPENTNNDVHVTTTIMKLINQSDIFTLILEQIKFLRQTTLKSLGPEGIKNGY
jgi:hypothetical protein